MYNDMRLRPRRVVMVIGAGTLITSLYYMYWVKQAVVPQIELSTLHNLNLSNFIVDTPGCTIPNVDPFDEQIESLVWRTGSIKCKGKADITYQDGEYLRIDNLVAKRHYNDELGYCEYQPIVRPNNTSDHRVTYTNTRQRFDHDIRVSHQFMRVYCYSLTEGVIYVNFHAFILPNRAADARLDNFKHHVSDDGLLEALNVIMMGMDSVSRLNSVRQLTRTRHYLINVLGGDELLGYNKVAENTFVNVVPMSMGKYVEELPWNEKMSHKPFDKYDFIWNRFQKKGFRTLFAEDAPNIAIFNYLKAGFHIPPADYYLRPFSLAMEKHRSLWNHNENCVGSRLETNIVLDWVRDFVTSSRDKPFFAFTFITRLTHNDVNVVGAADEPHLKFIKSLHRSGSLDNSVLFYFSDHGMRFGDIRTTYIGKMEDRLPFMVIVFPPWFRKKYPILAERVRTNARRLTTPFDIHETLVDLLYFTKSVGTRKATDRARGISLFDEIPDTRTCVDATVLPHWCSCQKHEVVSTENEIIQQGAKAGIIYINERTSKYRTVCAELSLYSIKESWRSIASEDVLRFKKSEHDVIDRHVVYGERTRAIVDYQMFIVTSPNRAIFEISVRHNEQTNSIHIVGDIVRVSIIGDESVCIGVHSLKKFCYCTYL